MINQIDLEFYPNYFDNTVNIKITNLAHVNKIIFWGNSFYN